MVPTGNRPKLAFAHVLRGFAAVLVLLCHLREAAVSTLLDQGGGTGEAIAASAAAPPLTAVNALILAGPVGVAVFFLVSGFVIPFAFRRQTRLGFLAERFWRIWPTYAAGFTIGLLVLAIAAAFRDQSFPYSPLNILAHYSLLVRDAAGLENIDMIVWTL